MLSNARHRAKRDGFPFSITLDDIDIPTHCPVLGRMLRVVGGKQGGGDDSPSLDKVIPSLGYVPGNVLVVSLKANRLKNQLSTEQLIAFARLYADAELKMKEQLNEKE